MFILKGLMVVLLLGVMPISFGKVIMYKDASSLEKNVINIYLIGFFSMLAIFQILCVPLTYMHVSFQILVWLYSIVLLILCGISVWLRRKKVKLIVPESIKLDKYEKVYLIICIILFLVQIYFFLFYEISYMSWDDYDYIVSSTAAIYDNGMYTTNIVTGDSVILRAKRTLTSYIIFISYLSQMSGFHTTTVAHTILPIFLLVMAYGVYYLIAKFLFKKRENRLIFMMLLSVVNIFGAYSHYTMTFRLLAAIWNGKSVMVVIGVPFLFVLLPRLFQDEFTKRKMWYLILITTGLCSLSMMGAGMSVVVIALMAGVYFIQDRKRKYIYYVCSGCLVPLIHIVLYLVLR